MGHPEWDRAVFATERAEVTIADAIDAACFRGELEPSWERVLALAGASADEPDETALQERSEQFRLERDLFTAEETERWLEERGLTSDDFSEFFRRHSREPAAGVGAEPRKLEYVSSPDPLRDLLRVELLMSGDFDRMAMRFAGRIAAREAAGDAPAAEAIEAERVRFHQRTGTSDTTLGGWLEGLGRDERWFAEMLELEAVFRQRSDQLLTTEALEQAIKSRWLPLTRFVVELLEVESSDAAREAFLCLTRDRASMKEVAAEGRYPHRQIELICEELSGELRSKLFSAAPGEVLKPMERGDGFQLYRLVERIEPDLADEEIRLRVEWGILERDFSELATRHVRWIIEPSGLL